MKVLVLGAGGMAGHVVSLYLKDNGFIVDTLSAHTPLDKHTKFVDVQNLDQFKKALSASRYAVVINCIGLLVKESEENQAMAIYINSFLPKFLEAYYTGTATKVIHISTNGVFSGKNAPYREDTPYDGEGFYSRTKALGEINNQKDLCIRTSIIGPELTKNGKSLFDWFYKQKGEVSGFTSSLWAGVTTVELARGIKEAIEQNISGVYHFVPDKKISKYDLLMLFARVFHKTITIKPTEGTAQDMSLINSRTDLNYHIPSYEIMVQEMKDWIESHKDIYGHYSA